MTQTIALAAGGTGGHMFPAQALAQEMCRRSWTVLLLTDDRGLRYATEFPADSTTVLDAANPNVRGPAAKLAMVMAMAKGVMTARRALQQMPPDIVVGFGGYPSAPSLFAAKFMGIPYAVHEQNAVLGRVNRKAAPGAVMVAHGFSQLDRLPKLRGELVHTGNPIRDTVLALSSMPYPSLSSDDALNVVIFGGSQGAHLFAKTFPEALAQMPAEIRSRLKVTHQVSDADQSEAARCYSVAGIEAELAPFFADLPDRIAASHFVIARAGASTVTELAMIGRPSLLVPLGIAMDDHQRANAEVLVSAGAATMLLERDLSAERAAALLLPMLNDPERLAAAAHLTTGLLPMDATSQLADRIEMLLSDGA